MDSASFRRWFNRQGLWAELLAEFMGTLILILFGDGVVAEVKLFLGLSSGAGSAVSNSASELIINFGWGFAVMLGVYVAGALTGAHLNPAVTLAFAWRRNFPWYKVIPYWLAQTIGAFCAAALLYLEYNTGFVSYEAANHITRGTPGSLASGTVFYTAQGAAIGGRTVPISIAFFDQVLGTALLVFLIMAVVEIRSTPPGSNLAPFIIGLIVVAIGMSFGVDAGYAINPARDFGPRLFAAFAGWGTAALPGVNGYFWVPIVGPLVGATIAPFVYDWTIQHSLLARHIGPTEGLKEEGRTVVEEHEGDTDQTDSQPARR